MAAAPLEVQARFGGRIFGGLVLVAVFTLPCFASATYGIATGSPGSKIGMAVGMALVNLAVFGLVPGLLVWRRRLSAQRFDETGITRFDGRHLPWSEYRSARRTMKRYRSGFTALWQLELQFASGNAIVLPSL